MLKYLIVPLSHDSVSFCHYEQDKGNSMLISIDDLRSAILWAMKENLTIQFLFPSWKLPQEYLNEIETIDHVKIVDADCEYKDTLEKADIIIFNGWNGLKSYTLNKEIPYVIRSDKEDFFKNIDFIANLLSQLNRLNIIITDIDKFSDSDFDNYREALKLLIPAVKDEYVKGHPVQFNLITDRMLLNEMNNCNAGWESITLAPNGNFYICPAFYIDGSDSVGCLKNGLNIKNPQLFRLDHAPICRVCDAWQCRRCVWLNRNTTLEINTPSHEQCVISHIEREAARNLLAEIRNVGNFLPNIDIQQLDYDDPFDKLMRHENN